MQKFVDVTDEAQEAGFDCRVQVTGKVWDQCCRWTEADTEKQDFQEEDARIWDIVFVGAMRLKRDYTEEMLRPPHGLRYEIYVLLRDGYSNTAVPVKLRITRKGLGLIISFADDPL